ncbi:MAG: hypothetical protein M8364_05270 [Methylobacter sp.]|uniref:hypothetical protein n=1 Tax=unclassified Methylobacter TaxID=2635283 RepID=UPI00055AC89B|nr:MULTISPECIES: hypothetical protein [unclassified Methylobacter]MCL7420295.1 hypothetical protein [Methylobacter sp.]
MSGVIVLFLGMVVLAAFSFAPLGYFIYKFSQKNAKPFGEIEPHGDSPSLVNDFAEKAISLFKGLVGKK